MPSKMGCRVRNVPVTPGRHSIACSAALLQYISSMKLRESETKALTTSKSAKLTTTYFRRVAGECARSRCRSYSSPHKCFVIAFICGLEPRRIHNSCGAVTRKITRSGGITKWMSAWQCSRLFQHTFDRHLIDIEKVLGKLNTDLELPEWNTPRMTTFEAENLTILAFSAWNQECSWSSCPMSLSRSKALSELWVL